LKAAGHFLHYLGAGEPLYCGLDEPGRLVIFSPNRYIFFMIFPLERLIEYKGNMYEITCAASRRAYQLSMLRDQEDNDGKIVSLAAAEVFTGEIEFRTGEPAIPERGLE
jgi:DNA-directed RNA polymerase subunit omega